jgi:ketol-acid reductoisomerase
MCVVPDELQADLYKNEIAPHLKKGAGLFFAHGFNIHFRLIEARADLDVVMVAPKGPVTRSAANIQTGGGCRA